VFIINAFQEMGCLFGRELKNKNIFASDQFIVFHQNSWHFWGREHENVEMQKIS
jgi:hypothetical protein